MLQQSRVAELIALAIESVDNGNFEVAILYLIDSLEESESYNTSDGFASSFKRTNYLATHNSILKSGSYIKTCYDIYF